MGAPEVFALTKALNSCCGVEDDHGGGRAVQKSSASGMERTQQYSLPSVAPEPCTTAKAVIWGPQQIQDRCETLHPSFSDLAV